MTSPEKLATPETVRKALQRAYSLGQTYWQQADSESFSQNRKADETAAKFQALVEETVACVLATQRQGEGEPDGWKLVPIEPTPEMVKAGYLHKHRDAYDPEADVYRAMLAAAPGATSQGVAVAQPDERIVKVSSQGVQFGNAWFSHEKITGYSAEQLNSGLCKVTGKAYMEWFSAAPPAPPAPLPYPQNLTPAQADARQKLIGLGGGRVGLDDDYEPPAPLPGKENLALLQQAYDALDSMGGFGFTQKASKAMHELHAAITSAKEQTK